MRKSITKFSVGVLFALLLLFLVDWVGITGPRWFILGLCGGLGILLGDAVFRQWSKRASGLENR